MADKSKEAMIGLGRWLGELRSRAGYSQWDFHPLTGYSRSALSDAELGRHLLRRDFWEAADKALNMNGQLLAGWELVAEMRDQERKKRTEERRQKRQAERRGGPLIAPDVHLISMTLAWSDGNATVLAPRKRTKSEEPQK